MAKSSRNRKSGYKNSSQKRDYKGRKPDNRKPREKWSDDREGNDRITPQNDISWYSRNPNLLAAASNFPFPYRAGMSVEVFNGITGGKYWIPGIMVLDWGPTIGQSALQSDPGSVLGNEFYSRVRQVYTGSLDADPPDYVHYVLALDSIFAYIAYLKRIYRVLTAWSPDNNFMPDGILTAMGFSLAQIANLRQNRTKLWQMINELVLQSRKFTVPASLDIINRHYWMSDNVYTDAPQINSQFYIFNMQYVYRYNPVINNPDRAPILQNMPGVEWVQIPIKTTPTTGAVEYLVAFGLSMIDALLAWDDSLTINGYLKKAFEGDSLFIVDELPQDAMFTPVYEPEVLMQIENSRAIPSITALDVAGTVRMAVIQNPQDNSIVCDNTLAVAVDEISTHLPAMATAANPLLSMRSEAPSAADCVIATRLTAGVTSATLVTNTSITLPDLGDASWYWMTFATGTEVPLRWRVSLPNIGSHVDGYPDYSFITVPQLYDWVQNKTATWNNRRMDAVLACEAFDWHPLIVILNDGGGDKFNTTLIAGDVHNVTSISVRDLSNLHRICLYSEFNSFGIF